MPILESCACFLASWALFLASASPSVSFEDTGELIVAAASLGSSHPPGYPWLLMLGRLSFLLPCGSPAFRMTLLSAACGAGAVTAAFALTRRFAGGTAPWMAAAALALSKTLWWQASIADKYTLSLFLMLLAVNALAGAWRERRAAALAAPAFLGGLALSHHLHGLYLVPVCLLAAWKLRPSVPRAVLLFALAALPMGAKAVAIPIRAAADPAMNWGVPDRADRLLYYMAARQYRFIMGANQGPADIATRGLRHLSVLPVAEFGPGLALAAPGLAALRAAGPGWLPGAGLVVAANLYFAVTYNTPEIERYYLLSYGLLAVLIGLGLGRLARSRRTALGLAALLLAIPAVRNARTSPRRHHTLAWDFAVNQLAPLPPRALLICEGDDQAFPLFHAQALAGLRPDVAVVPMPFACWEPAYRLLPAHIAGMAWPRFEANPGRHLPRLMAANPLRPAFYTPGCSGEGSEGHLLPRGAVFAAFADPAEHERARRVHSRFPRLRLRGAADAAAWADGVSARAVRNYGIALAYHGAEALEHADAAGAARFLAEALRLPMADTTRAAALTHLGLALGVLGRVDEAEPRYRAALAADPAFGPAMFQLGKLLLIRQRSPAEARELLMNAARNQKFLNAGERDELQRMFRGGRRR